MRVIKKYKEFWVVGIFLILMVVATLKDLDISQSLINKDSGWAILLEKIAEQPAMILGFIGSSILMKLYKSSKAKYMLLSFSAFFAVFGFWILSTERWFGIENSEVIILEVVFSIGLIVVTQMLLINVERETLKSYRNPAMVTVICTLLMQLVLQGGLKVVWGRVRPRDLLGDFSNFTPWYLPQGITGNGSFPSGHSFNGWALLLITLYIKKDNNKLYNFTWVLAIAFGILVSLSRIIVAAHFTSDVVAGAMIMIVSFYISKRIIYREK